MASNALKGKTVALTLGSGGARGYAHIGVLEVLQEKGCEIVSLSGCSMGALVGGVFAAGKLKPFKDWATGLDQLDIIRLLDLSLGSPGAIRGEKVFSFVRELIGDTNIEDLPFSYTAVATDLLSHKEIWFQEGPLHQAIRASVAIPSLLTPVVMGDRLLVDGGLLNPLPITPTVSSHADLVIAVNLSHQDGAEIRLPASNSKKAIKTSVEIENWIERVKQKTIRLFDKDALATVIDLDDDHRPEVEFNTEGKKPDQKDEGEKGGQEETEAKNSSASLRSLGLGKFDVMNLAFETMQSSLTQYKLAGYPPDILINIPKHVCKTFEYHKAPELIQLGRTLAEKSLEEFEVSHRTQLN